MDLSIDAVTGELVTITLAVPAHAVLGLQTAVVRYLEVVEGETRNGSAWTPTFGSSHGPKNAWELPEWHDTADDAARMKWLVGDLDRKHLEILHHIINQPGTPTRELLAAAGYPPGARASGVFRAIGSRFRRCDRRPLWTGGEQTPDGQALGVTDNVTALRLFSDALAVEVRPAGPETGEASELLVWTRAVERAELTDADIELVRAFRSLPGHAGTAQHIADALGYDSYRPANLAMGRFGKRLAAARTAVDSAYTPSAREDGSTMWWHVVANGEVGDDGLFWWTLRSELDAALVANGI